MEQFGKINNMNKGWESNVDIALPEQIIYLLLILSVDHAFLAIAKSFKHNDKKL